MPKDYIGTTVKWAHTEKDAVKTIVAKNPQKNGECVFKRGGLGKIITVQQLENK